MAFTPTAVPSANGATTVVPEPAKPARMRLTRPLIIGAASIIVAVIIATVLWRAFVPASIVLVTTPVQQGTLVRTVTASGTVNPQNTISIGSQVSGTISEVDVDYNSVVHTGQVLATIDPTSFQAALDQAQAQLAQTEANCARSGGRRRRGAGGNHRSARHRECRRSERRRRALERRGANRCDRDRGTNVAKAQSALVLAQQTIARDRAS